MRIYRVTVAYATGIGEVVDDFFYLHEEAAVAFSKQAAIDYADCFPAISYCAEEVIE